eukprot:CCRYP_014879-RA/>CCRYP_014879-RA protein AED:0.44 eAED:0.44 QI:40/1/1/1/0/0/2/101/36
MRPNETTVAAKKYTYATDYQRTCCKFEVVGMAQNKR